MRKKIILLILIIGTSLCSIAQNPANELAKSMAQKMKDSLQLSEKQEAAIYAINMRLHFQKMNMRSIYKSADSLQSNIQRVENTRDSLYSTVISREKYLRYQQKKSKNVVEKLKLTAAF